MRKVNVFSTNSDNVQSVMSAAATWGELKNDLGSLVNNDMKVTIRETRTNLEDDNGVLPEGEFTIFTFPTKIKSGK